MVNCCGTGCGVGVGVGVGAGVVGGFGAGLTVVDDGGFGVLVNTGPSPPPHPAKSIARNASGAAKFRWLANDINLLRNDFGDSPSFDGGFFVPRCSPATQNAELIRSIRAIRGKSLPLLLLLWQQHKHSRPNADC